MQAPPSFSFSFSLRFPPPTKYYGPESWRFFSFLAQRTDHISMSVPIQKFIQSDDQGGGETHSHKRYTESLVLPGLSSTRVSPTSRNPCTYTRLSFFSSCQRPLQDSWMVFAVAVAVAIVAAVVGRLEEPPQQQNRQQRYSAAPHHNESDGHDGLPYSIPVIFLLLRSTSPS